MSGIATMADKRFSLNPDEQEGGILINDSKDDVSSPDSEENQSTSLLFD